MKQNARFQLVVAAALFVGWLCWLAYIAATGTHPVILSRPQILAADVNVLATVSGDAKANSHVIIKKVISKLDPKDKLEKGDEIEVVNLDKLGPEQGWLGPGDYLLPLRKSGPLFAVVPNPELPKEHPQIVRIYAESQQVNLQAQKILGERE